MSLNKENLKLQCYKTVNISKNPFTTNRVRNELCFLIEDRDTCLRLWVDYDGTLGESRVNPPNTIYMRLDKYQAYSVPLNNETYNYLEDKKGIIKQLLPYGFKSSIDNLDDVLTIVAKLKPKQLKSW
jgi:hypothetical protein